jgi:hypothetical protein
MPQVLGKLPQVPEGAMRLTVLLQGTDEPEISIFVVPENLASLKEDCNRMEDEAFSRFVNSVRAATLEQPEPPKGMASVTFQKRMDDFVNDCMILYVLQQADMCGAEVLEGTAVKGFVTGLQS